MKRLVLILTVAMGIFSCKEPVDETPALDVTPILLEFAAADAGTQTITVNAKNVEWKHSVAGESREWIKVETNDNSIRVSVTENKGAEQRIGQITITATDNDKIPRFSVSVIQKANDHPVEMWLKAEPALLEFDAEDTTHKEIFVTVSDESLTWTAAPDKDCEGWLTVTPASGKINVSVSDNPLPERRTGTVIITPSDKAAESKSVRIVQQAKVSPPSLKVDRTDPIEWAYNNNDGVLVKIMAVNVNWEATAVDAAGITMNWVGVFPDRSAINIVPERNPSKESRSGFVVITPDNTELDEIRIAISQTGAPDHLSTLTDDIDIATLKLTRGLSYLTPYNKDDTLQPTIAWDVNIVSEGIDYEPNFNQYGGTGSRVHFELITERIEVNDDNIYVIPDGTYNIIPAKPYPDDPQEYYFKDPWTIDKGIEGMGAWNKYSGFWYTELSDGEVVDVAPMDSGTVTVTKQPQGQNTYTFEFNMKDDFGNSITGAYTGSIGLHVNGELLPD